MASVECESGSTCAYATGQDGTGRDKEECVVIYTPHESALQRQGTPNHSGNRHGGLEVDNGAPESEATRSAPMEPMSPIDLSSNGSPLSLDAASCLQEAPAKPDEVAPTIAWTDPLNQAVGISS